MLLPLEVDTARVPSDWSSNRLPAGTAVLTMMEGTRIPDAKRKKVPMSPATNSSTEKPSRDGCSSVTLAD